MDKDIELSLLYDFYGALLSERQKEVLGLYHEENLSLSEIADEFGISRQAVHDALKNGQTSLLEYESKLGLVKKFTLTNNAVNEIDSRIDDMIESNECDSKIRNCLLDIKAIIDDLN